MARAVALTIAGSDSGGGAGIQADLKTFHAFGVFGTSAITAVTAQDTKGVHAVHTLPPEMVRAQIAAVAQDLHPAACKSGMLATREIVDVVAESIREHGLQDYVLDPVMVATSGDRLLDRDAESALSTELLPICRLITPNIDEAAILVRRPLHAIEDLDTAAAYLIALGARAALVKGGHLEGDDVVDVLHDGHEIRRFRRPRLDSRNTHGTGCTLSAAIAARLAQGRPLVRAVEDALDFVHRAIASAPDLGAGNGPLDHFASVSAD
jgi:hydroxymethylpyrimidine/phosphomethylpyrimidine kinase